MDGFVDPFLSSSSWSDMNTSSRSSWGDNAASQTDGFLANDVEAYEGEEKNPSLSMIPPSLIVGNVASEEVELHGQSDTSSIFTNASYTTHHENKSQDDDFLLKGIFGSDSPSYALSMSNAVERNGNAQSISSVPTMWPPSYLDQRKLQSFGFQGMGNDGDAFGKYQHLNNSAASYLHDPNELQSSQMPTFSLGQQMIMTSTGLQKQQEVNALPSFQVPNFSAGLQMNSTKPAVSQPLQTSQQSMDRHVNNSSGGQGTPATAGGCNGVTKPRVRARRGQATDPHSIAERLRREKIAERMKNLQELVPNANKTDKGSMLDEIIDYVKFLQLQVKVLSMSRLGAAGAVVPLITDVHSELSSTRQQSPLSNTDEDENSALEQEVAKMMETNITAAMQYLQQKGLCLMPVALASAISSSGAHNDIKQENIPKP